MGGAILHGLSAHSLLNSVMSVTVIDPSHKNLPLTVTHRLSPTDLPPDYQPDLILCAVKPQQLAEVLPHYRRFTTAPLLSIAAGVTTSRLASVIGHNRIIRAMPNLPASIGEGITAAYATPSITEQDKQRCRPIFDAMGSCLWIEDETQMDAVTALSGSGPAYVFALTEAMTEAGINLGLPPDLAATLARQTLAGSGALLNQSTETATELRRAVTSPGGTTEAALHHLLAPHNGLQKLLIEAMTSAANRSRELSA